MDDYASSWQLASATAFASSGAVALHDQRA
ncbi:hypothetical protein FHS42_004915 [Streptomyces zagrosensis]|uniref:Uncharacterized protein n=1 Tax=Streptomyces zagrosensis TaxID=1042984 RepID=A0A7W9V127_9ACTN|nr:hypothetical protein [Streptomyces zagrosensis]